MLFAGIGPEISQAVKDIYTAASVRPSLCSSSLKHHMLILMQVPVEWEEVSVNPILKDGKTVIPDKAIHSIKKNTVALKVMIGVLSRHNPSLTFDIQVLWLPLVRSSCYITYDDTNAIAA